MTGADQLELHYIAARWRFRMNPQGFGLGGKR
jgi:hypothetical protein